MMSWTLRTAANALRRGDLKSAYHLCAWGIREQYFERSYGIDSARIVSVPDLRTDPSVSELYEPTSYLILNTVFSRIKPKAQSDNEVLLDIGCGMGRAVVAAATYPYSAIIGIEISEDLLHIARQNVARSTRRRKCHDIRLERRDALEYPLPDEVTTIFFYNPFRGETLRRFIENIGQSLIRRHRTITIAFVNPSHFNVAEYPWIKVIEEINRFYPGREGGLTIWICRAQL